MITVEQLRRARAKGFHQPFVFQKAPAVSHTAGQFYHSFQTGGIPAAGAYDGSIGVKQFDGDIAAPSHSSGLVLFNDATPPKVNFLSFLKSFNPSSNGAGFLYLLDLLAEYSSVDTTSAAGQSTGSALGSNDLPRYQDGEGVFLMVDTETTLGGTGRAISFDVTDQDGNTATLTGATTIASAVKSKISATPGPFVPMAAGVRGIKSVQTVTLAASTGAGSLCMLLVKLLAAIPLVGTNFIGDGDFVNGQPFLPKLEDGACLSLLFGPATTNTPIILGGGELLEVDPDDLDA